MKNLINKLIEKFFTREVISYLIFGVLTTVVNFVFYWLFTEVFAVYYIICIREQKLGACPRFQGSHFLRSSENHLPAF